MWQTWKKKYSNKILKGDNDNSTSERGQESLVYNVTIIADWIITILCILTWKEVSYY